MCVIAGPVEIAAVGVAASIINQANKVTIFPLVNITTSFVAEETAANEVNEVSSRADDSLEGVAAAQMNNEKEGAVDSEEVSEFEIMESGYVESSDTNGSPTISEITRISLQSCKSTMNIT